MIRVFKNSWFVRFARKEGIADQQLLETARKVRDNITDADLGGGVFKQRLARQGHGKAKGYRAIMLFDGRSNAFFVYGFAKKDMANIRDDEVEMFKKMAKHVFSLTAEQLRTLIDRKQFEEVLKHDEKI
jgi:hypothetical protein